MSAKIDLFSRLEYLSAAVQLPSLIDVGIAINEHNGVANLLRKGLGIVAFNILEDYIKNKSTESLSILSNSTLPFANLTEFLQESAILGALDALNYRADIEKKDGNDWKTLVQEEALKIHSTSQGTYKLSKFSLVYKGANISSNEVGDLLKAFGIIGGWVVLKSVSDHIGGGLPDLNQAYKNAANRRHSAAHIASFSYDYSWIANIKNEILTIAAALDIVLSARCRQIEFDTTKKINDHTLIAALNYRFLEPSGNIYRETIAIGGRSKKNWLNLSDAVSFLQPRLRDRNEFLIVLNNMRRVEDWFT